MWRNRSVDETTGDLMTIGYGMIVVLTGAGISAESGIQTFRDSGGLWENHRLEDVASPDGFFRNPDLVQTFYNERRKRLLSDEVQPNPAHEALAKLEREYPGEVFLITQNIDDLHERAGSRNLVHMHGRLFEVRCTDTGKVFPWKEDVTPDSRCECCGIIGTLRPNVVWFGEVPMEMDVIFQKLHQCDLFMAVGTSGNVYPASGFVQEVKQYTQAHTVELNLEPSMIESLFDERIYGPASEIVPRYVSKLLSAKDLA